jgi:uncharacterized OsmC-like protein
MRVTARFLEGYKFEMVSDHLSITSDQSPQYGGDGAGPMPSELFLWAIASCIGQSIVHILGKFRETTTDLTLSVEGKKHPDQFRYRKIIIDINGDYPEPRLKEVVKIACDGCFISNSLAEDIEIEINVGGSA